MEERLARLGSVPADRPPVGSCHGASILGGKKSPRALLDAALEHDSPSEVDTPLPSRPLRGWD